MRIPFITRRRVRPMVRPVARVASPIIPTNTPPIPEWRRRADEKRAAHGFIAEIDTTNLGS